MSKRNSSINFIAPLYDVSPYLNQEKEYINCFTYLNNKRGLYLLFSSDFVDNEKSTSLLRNNNYVDFIETDRGLLFMFNYSDWMDETYNLYEIGRYSKFPEDVKNKIIFYNGGKFYEDENTKQLKRSSVNIILNPTLEDKLLVRDLFGADVIPEDIHPITKFENENFVYKPISKVNM